MSLTNQQALAMHFTLQKLSSRDDLQGKFAYAVMRNLKNLKPVVDSLSEIRKPVEGFKEFEDERVALCESYAQRAPEVDENGMPKKDSNGEIILSNNPAVSQGQYVIDTDKIEELDSKIKALKTSDKYASVISQMESKELQLKEMLNDDAQIEVFKVSPDYIPNNISPNELSILDEMLQG